MKLGLTLVFLLSVLPSTSSEAQATNSRSIESLAAGSEIHLAALKNDVKVTTSSTSALFCLLLFSSVPLLS